MANRLVSRTLVGIGLILLVLGAVFVNNPIPLTLLTAVWAAIATVEFLRLLAIAEIRLVTWLIVSLNAATVMAGQLGWLPGFLIVPLAVVLIAAVASPQPRPRVPVYGVFTVFYLGFLPAHLVMLKNLIRREGLSLWLVMFPLILTWVSDTAAFAMGRLAGRHHLAPQLSPRKTIEGFLAGLLAGAVISMVWLRTLIPFATRPLWWLAAVGTGVSALGQLGDLFESIFKRAVGLKDSSNLLGEHGGFLDRCDSLLFAIPAFYYLIALLSAL